MIKANFINENLGKYDLSAQYLHYDKETNTLSGEVSDLPPFDIKDTLVVLSPKTGATKAFNHYKTDMDGTQEDTYGWRYRSDDGIELLIIND